MVWAVLNQNVAAALDEIERTGSDRVVAIVGGAILDHVLWQALAYRMRGGTSSIDSLEKGIRDFSARIHFAYLLYAFEKDERETLLALANIRNVFAHDLFTTFDATHEGMARAFGKLTLHVGLTHYPNALFSGNTNIPIEPPTSRRELFMTNVRLLMIVLMRDLHSHQPYSNIQHLLSAPPP